MQTGGRPEILRVIRTDPNISGKCMFFSRKKKVGYLAWLGSNYGSTLQAFALYQSIISLGYDCEIIGYRPFISVPALDEALRDSDPKKYDWIRTRKLFTDFMKGHFKFSSETPVLPKDAVITSKAQRKLKKYDAFICGSDQIWKPSGFWFHPVQYLQFAPVEKRVSYAPSVGWEKIPKTAESNIPLWQYWLSSFPYLSSRESAGASLIENVTGRKAHTVTDPTMLLTPDTWLKLLCDPAYPSEVSGLLKAKKRYLLAYLLDTYETYRDYVIQLAQKLELEVVWLTGRDNKGTVQINCSETDPAGFVNLIANADLVCADGFHGCCFSVNFSKNFLYLSPGDDFEKSNDSRLHELFSRFGISGRFVTPSTQNRFDFPDIDYEAVQKNVSTARELSINYLCEALRGATRNEGELYKEIREYSNLIKNTAVTVLKPHIILKNAVPEFSYNEKAWECHIIKGAPALFPIKIKSAGGRFACTSLGTALSIGMSYRMSVKFKCRTDAESVFFHLYDPLNKVKQVIHKIKMSDSNKDRWLTVDFSFIPVGNTFSAFMIAASQITGEGRYISISSITLEAKAKC
jgi:hypothetical protein